MAVGKRPTSTHKLTAGVLGGMGPQATVDFMAQVVALTPADSDQDHVPMLVDNNPRVPDRQAAMRSGDGSAVSAALVEMARRLEAAGADFLVMPCNTAHAYYAEAVAAVAIPFVSIIDVTVDATIDAVTEEAGDVERVGLLATDACLSSRVYQTSAAAKRIDLLTPAPDAQTKLMELIFRVKSGVADEAAGRGMAAIATELVDDGAAALIAGCTEIPLVLEPSAVRVPLVSSTEALARRTVALATGGEPIVNI